MASEVILPWPDKELSPNSRGHWRKRHDAAKAAKQTAWAATLAAKLSVPAGARLHLWLDFYPPDRRRRDDDNLVAACKPYRDGLALALGIDDCHFALHLCLHHDDVRPGGEVRMRVSSAPERGA